MRTATTLFLFHEVRSGIVCNKSSPPHGYGIPPKGTLDAIQKSIDNLLSRSSLLLDPEPLNFLLHTQSKFVAMLSIGEKKDAWHFAWSLQAEL